MANNEVFTSRDYIERLDKKFNIINGPIVDDCCGHGVWLKYAKDKGCEVWGCDIVPENCMETIKLLYGDGKIEYLTDNSIPENMRCNGLKGIFTLDGEIVKNIVCADSMIWSFAVEYKTKSMLSKQVFNMLFE